MDNIWWKHEHEFDVFFMTQGIIKLTLSMIVVAVAVVVLVRVTFFSFH